VLSVLVERAGIRNDSPIMRRSGFDSPSQRVTQLRGL
jgi:hypothetical protein